MNTGYQSAIELAKTKLRSGNGNYYTHINWFGKETPVESGNEIEQVLWLHYLASEGSLNPTGKLIAFREIKGAMNYEPKFAARAIRPIIKTFGNQPQALIKAGEALGGIPAKHGDAAITVTPLINIPLTYIIWAGDDEFPADGNVLFDETAPFWLPAEDLVFLVSLCSYKLLAKHREVTL